MADVICISNTVQEFLGERYYLCGHYFQHNGKRLHRVVWEYHNGKIPDGYHIHHKDHNRYNNSIDNLQMLEEKEHFLEHKDDEKRKEIGRKNIVLAREAAKEWHHSEEGRRWHSVHGKENAMKRQPRMYVCTWCGCEYQSKQIRYTGNHFCCNNHKAAYRRKKVRDESCSN